jgi:hypothetical protein
MALKLSGRTALLAGVLALAAGCGQTVSSEGTNLLVSVDWATGNVYSLTISGTENTTSFPSQTAPASVPTAALASPQSLLVLLPDTAAGAAIEVRVVAKNQNGKAILEARKLSPNIVLHQQTTMEITLEAVATDGGTSDAGASDAGEPDAGTPDAGTLDAGAPDAGAHDAGTPDAGFVGTCGTLHVQDAGTFVSCSQGMGCQSCALRGNACAADGTCRCGAGPACGAGLRCSVAGACVCDALSDCAGCCEGSGPTAACNTTGLVSVQACGTAGFACVTCNGGNATCAQGVCSGQSCGASECASGDRCETVSYPVAWSFGGACVACDPLRTNNLVVGACSCGLSGPCAATEYCRRAGSGAATCVALPQ